MGKRLLPNLHGVNGAATGECRRTRRLLNALVVLSLSSFVFWVGCGKENPYRGRVTNEPVSNPPTSTVTLALFGAPWCSNCKNDFPQIQQLLNELPRERAERVALVLYVTTGATAQDRPTDEIAQTYKEALKLKATAFADEWRWKKFREYVGGSLVLPGAAILDADGKVLKAFRAGAGTFIPSEIVKTAEEATK